MRCGRKVNSGGNWGGSRMEQNFLVRRLFCEGKPSTVVYRERPLGMATGLLAGNGAS